MMSSPSVCATHMSHTAGRLRALRRQTRVDERADAFHPQGDSAAHGLDPQPGVSYSQADPDQGVSYAQVLREWSHTAHL